ncbi:MAG: class I SAM-dependent methyltransferase [Deltaproteobacteria bacterium]|nr:class I SAM-dependent methyltransferase [Nannocystaceae bacterium]
MAALEAMITVTDQQLKQAVREHWERQPCGTRGVGADERRRFFETVERERYEVDAHIPGWARFERGRDRDVLEIGVGAGTDFMQWVRAGARATGIDMTDAGIELTRERLELEGRNATLLRGDAEQLPFSDESFDVVYSYGVLHHTPDTPRAFAEAWRVLRPGGTLLAMIYRVPSLTGFLLWGMHCAAKLHPLTSPRQAIYEHLESPGTKAYRDDEVRSKLLPRFREVKLDTALLAGDLLSMRASEKYQGGAAKLIWSIYPRGLIRRFGKPLGLGLLIEATK